MKSCVHDVSFIVIALNEEFAVQKCLESIYRLNTQDCELICIDSDSKDNTLEIMQKYAEKIPNTKIFKIKGDCNAAIARNVGIRNATKEFYFFIDGDVEISEIFLANALIKLRNFGAVCGNIEDVEYDKYYQNIMKTNYRYAKNGETITNHTGGIFLTKKQLVKRTGLFDERLLINEDVDFSLRLGKIEPILYIPLSMGKHHTVPYTEPDRLCQMIKKQHGIYTGMLLRKHITNKNIVPFFKTQPGLFIGIPFYGLIILFSLSYKITNYSIPILIFLADLAYGLYQKKDIKHRIFMHFLSPIPIIKGFLGLYDRKRLKYSAEHIASIN